MRTPLAARIALRVALCITCFVLGACASTPDESFYTLSPAAPAAPANGRKAAASYSVAIGPVHVPDIVDRPQLVVRKGATQVQILEQHRWAQPLHAEIAQALSADLAASLPQARISFDNDAAGRNADYAIAVDIKRFEAVPGEAVFVQAIWSIRTAGDKAPLTRQSTVREAVNGGYDALAAGFARALVQISKEIAQAVSSLQPSGTGSAGTDGLPATQNR
jgi:uncharacterized protein